MLSELKWTEERQFSIEQVVLEFVNDNLKVANIMVSYDKFQSTDSKLQTTKNQLLSRKRLSAESMKVGRRHHIFKTY